jgi:NADP-dependent 3-hydroxy acid dehydrogenase YdfG
MAASKVIILTGASRGIGLAIAHYLLKQSHKLVVVARSAGPLEALEKEYPGQVKALPANLSDFSVRILFSPFLVVMGWCALFLRE